MNWRIQTVFRASLRPAAVDTELASIHAGRRAFGAVVMEFKVSRADVVSRSNKRLESAVRHAAAFWMYESGMSLAAIGKEIRRDHTTVFASVRAAVELMRKDPGFRRRMLAIRAQLNLYPSSMSGYAGPTNLV